MKKKNATRSQDEIDTLHNWRPTLMDIEFYAGARRVRLSQRWL